MPATSVVFSYGIVVGGRPSGDSVQDQRDVSSSDDVLRVDWQSVVLDDRGVDVAPLVGSLEAA